jgi:hypothetical protein
LRGLPCVLRPAGLSGRVWGWVGVRAAVGRRAGGGKGSGGARRAACWRVFYTARETPPAGWVCIGKRRGGGGGTCLDDGADGVPDGAGHGEVVAVVPVLLPRPAAPLHHARGRKGRRWGGGGGRGGGTAGARRYRRGRILAATGGTGGTGVQERRRGIDTEPARALDPDRGRGLGCGQLWRAVVRVWEGAGVAGAGVVRI